MKIIHTSVEEMAMRRLLIGFEGENQRATVRIDCASVFAEYPNATPALIVKPMFASAYPVVVERDGDYVDWLITSEILSFTGDGEIQLVFYKDQVICKSAIAKIRVCRSLQVTGDMPDPVVQWVDDANRKLAEVDAQIVELEGMVDTATDAATRAEQSASTASTAAEQAAGSAATATAKANEAQTAAGTATAKAAEAQTAAQTATSKATDAAESERIATAKAEEAVRSATSAAASASTATQKAEEAATSAQAAQVDYSALSEEVTDLKSSLVLVQANQPIEDVNKLWVDSDTVTETEVPTMDEFNGLESAINDKYTKPSDGIPASDLASGAIPEVPVQDVQVAGQSVVVDGVANVSVMGSSNFGVAKLGNGLGINANGALSTNNASDAAVKNGDSTASLLVPARQHMSTFYGLAKAAGADMASSSNPVGTYTDEAKVAIQKMLGIYEAPWELIREDTFTNAATSTHEITVDGNGQPFELTDAILMFETPTQGTDSSANGNLVFTNGTNNISGVYCNPWTQAANATAHGCWMVAENRNGLVFVIGKNVSSSTNEGSIDQAYAEGFTSSTSQGIMENENYIVRGAKIAQVKGTGHYKLYGKRKWN